MNNGADVIYTGPVAIGATDPPLPDVGKPTPTPTGEYYLRVLLQAPDPNTVYGPYAYGLSSHSETLDSFAGGDAEVGIHGNNDASVLGTDATHGCIRMDNDAITMLAKQLPLGTPGHRQRLTRARHAVRRRTRAARRARGRVESGSVSGRQAPGESSLPPASAQGRSSPSSTRR